MSSRTINLTQTLYQYILDHSVREPVVLRELREATAKIPHAVMQISPEQGQFMQMLVKLTGAKRCVEIGVFTGYSSLSVALALPPDGKIVACDVNEEWTGIARRYWKKAGMDSKIDLRIAPALETLDGLSAGGDDGTFDFAFIDADKGNYFGYYERCLKLLRKGGLVVVDNTLWSGDVANLENKKPDTVALRKFNDALHHDERIELSLLPIGDGVTLALKK
jgi:predicted O-methyltransferase YrrM